MFSDLKPYSSVRDSRAPWLGEVPDHWTVTAARSVFAEVGPAGHIDEPLLSVTISRGVVPQAEVLATSGKRDSSNLDRSKYKLVEVGDIVYNKMRAWQGAVGLSLHRGIVSPAYIVVRPRRDQGRFLHHLLRTPAFAKEAERWSYGITSDQWSLRPEHFKMIGFAIPPLDEQDAIVKYLGHAHRRIDQAIAAKQKLITLLGERRLAEVSHVIRRGLNADVRLVNSGVTWLGAVPAHWVISALRHRYSQVLGKMLDSRRITGENALPYLRNTDVQWGRVNTVDLPEMDVSPHEYARYTVRPGDLLVCEGGEVGRAAIWNGTGRLAFQKALHRLRPLAPERDEPTFLLLALRAATAMGAFSDGHVSTIAHLTGEKLRRHRFAWPPPGEQREIVAHVKREALAIDAAMERTDHEIELLREFRTRLTADVVTGQIDIRHIAVTLPDVESTIEPLDVDAEDEDMMSEELLEAAGA